MQLELMSFCTIDGRRAGAARKHTQRRPLSLHMRNKIIGSWPRAARNMYKYTTSIKLYTSVTADLRYLSLRTFFPGLFFVFALRPPPSCRHTARLENRAGLSPARSGIPTISVSAQPRRLGFVRRPRGGREHLRPREPRLNVDLYRPLALGTFGKNSRFEILKDYGGPAGSPRGAPTRRGALVGVCACSCLGVAQARLVRMRGSPPPV